MAESKDNFPHPGRWDDEEGVWYDQNNRKITDDVIDILAANSSKLKGFVSSLSPEQQKIFSNMNDYQKKNLLFGDNHFAELFKQYSKASNYKPNFTLVGDSYWGSTATEKPVEETVENKPDDKPLVKSTPINNGIPQLTDTFTGSKLFKLIYPEGSNKFFDDPEHNKLPKEGLKFDLKYLFSDKNTRKEMASAQFANKAKDVYTEQYLNPDYKTEERRNMLINAANETKQEVKNISDTIGKVTSTIETIPNKTQTDNESLSKLNQASEELSANDILNREAARKIAPAVGAAATATASLVGNKDKLVKKAADTLGEEGREEDAEQRRRVAYKKAEQENFEALESNRQATIGNMISGVGNAFGKFKEGVIRGRHYNRKG